ncbi:bifunctional acetate--CoA ligase family protein/GNAT family N-acetyltransferase [Granulosicoccus antarcticus]|uniref:Acetyltransferase Pat n=1 Tax=Granulosicoccus antarcticus IMCC3135 TaxID=1192854 RepID=A0A2Z2NMV3_9GAMM|nr:bifunctional acetate--CoA ligase family protein/GNAT family N-acetyltransferase [Granulosicoccus antarcticus]ASJ71058.1 Acetyltransferase Pat [Granulosicoccus antarcticus IMCC3135]
MSTLHLDKILNPASLVVVGASAREESPGYKVTRNLLQGSYKGTLFLVNPRYKTILDASCYRTIASLPDVPDLAIIITPVRLVKHTLRQCARKGIQVALVMSGAQDNAALQTYAKRLGIRLMGPCCAGLIRPHIGLNATYSQNRIEKGSLAIVSQSASLGAAMLDWAETSGVGFSALLSSGDEIDISLSDLLDLLADDWQTKAVIVYVDRVKSSRSMLSALSATARLKPVVLMSSAQERVRYCDALTRTGEVYSSESVFQAALSRAGVVRIRTFHNLFAAARTLATGIRVKGNRLAIVSNASAPAMIALDRMNLKQFQTPLLDKQTRGILDKKLKGRFTGSNPIVIRKPSRLADYYTRTIETLQGLDDIDAILVIFVPDWRNDPKAIAESLKQLLPSKKPLLACWMGDASVHESRDLLALAGIPSFRTPEGSIDGFDFLNRYFVSQQLLLQLPNPASRSTRSSLGPARALINTELKAGARVLGPVKTRTLLEYLDIPVLQTLRAESLSEALEKAATIGYPVAMKLVSPNISYKASVIETQLDIATPEAVATAWHAIEARLLERRPEAHFRGVQLEPMYAPKNSRFLALSVTRDPTFGPAISIGVGGDLTALVSQRAVQLPPLNRYLIDDLLKCREVQVHMGAFRHSEAVNQRPVGRVLRQLSELVCELPDVFSVDINPLVVSEDGAMAMDVQVVLERNQNRKRYSHLAIHPYPWQWVRHVNLKNNTPVQLRPIRPEDAESIRTLVRDMSPESRYFRFMHALNELSPRMVAQFTKLDYDRQMAFVATDRADKVAGACRYMISNDRLGGEFAISISEDWKGYGLASALMRLMIEHARAQGLQNLHGDVLRSNSPMQALMRSLGFTSKRNPDEPEVVIFEYQLDEPTEHS